MLKILIPGEAHLSPVSLAMASAFSQTVIAWLEASIAW